MSIDLQRAARLAVGLEDARDTLRSFLGLKYAAIVKPFRDVIRGLADEKHDGNELAAMLEIERNLPPGTDAETRIKLLAAACDECESS